MLTALFSASSIVQRHRSRGVLSNIWLLFLVTLALTEPPAHAQNVTVLVGAGSAEEQAGGRRVLCQRK